MNKRWNHFVKDRVLQNTWKKKKAVSVLMVFLIACGLICYTAAVQQKQELLLYQSQVTLFQRDRQFYTYEDAKQMRQRNEEAEEPLSYAIWGTEGMHVLENPVLRRSSMVEIYAVEGNSQLLFPSAVMLNPALTGGCLLGEKAAQELFGVSDASGLTFTHGWTQLSGAGHAGAEDAGSSVSGGRSAYNEAGTDDSRDIRSYDIVCTGTDGGMENRICRNCI